MSRPWGKSDADSLRKKEILQIVDICLIPLDPMKPHVETWTVRFGSILAWLQRQEIGLELLLVPFPPNPIAIIIFVPFVFGVGVAEVGSKSVLGVYNNS